MVERPPSGTPLAKLMEIPAVVRLAKLLVTTTIYFRTLTCRDLYACRLFNFSTLDTLDHLCRVIMSSFNVVSAVRINRVEVEASATRRMCA